MLQGKTPTLGSRWTASSRLWIPRSQNGKLHWASAYSAELDAFEVAGVPPVFEVLEVRRWALGIAHEGARLGHFLSLVVVVARSTVR